MITCKNCKRQTMVREPTGLRYTYKQWTDNDGTVHKDISSQEIICIDCLTKEG